FYELIVNHIAKQYEDVSFYEYNAQDIETIEKLADEKYRKWDWNFGYSPKYTFQKSSKTDAGQIDVYILVDKGIIQEFKFYGDFFNVKDKEEIEQVLIGKRHNPDDINEVLNNFDVALYFDKVNQQELLSAMF